MFRRPSEALGRRPAPGPAHPRHPWKPAPPSRIALTEGLAASQPPERSAASQAHSQSLERCSHRDPQAPCQLLGQLPGRRKRSPLVASVGSGGWGEATGGQAGHARRVGSLSPKIGHLGARTVGPTRGTSSAASPRGPGLPPSGHLRFSGTATREAVSDARLPVPAQIQRRGGMASGPLTALYRCRGGKGGGWGLGLSALLSPPPLDARVAPGG
jgi:hypothetical protein